MNYRLLISDESSLDIIDTFLWYETQREGLGKDFELCLEAGFNTLLRNPHICQIKYNGVRVYYITRFPYGIHYLAEKDEIRVMGIFHTSRNPKSWSERLNKQK